MPSTMAASSSDLKGPAWTLTGGIGGAMMGATIAGPFGAIVGCGVGVFAGGVRAVSGKSLAEFYSMPAGFGNKNALASFEKMLPPAAASGNCTTGKACAPGATEKKGHFDHMIDLTL